MFALLLTISILNYAQANDSAPRTIWQPHPASGCEMKDIMIPPGRLNMTRPSREESQRSCQKFCDRLNTFGIGCHAMAVQTREWDTMCLLCKNPYPDDELMPFSTFYSRTVEPKEGSKEYCNHAQEWIDYQDRLCSQICSHKFYEDTTPTPTSEIRKFATEQWRKISDQYKLGDYYDTVSGTLEDTLGKWPTPLPTEDPIQLQRCEGCHLDRADMIKKVDGVGCRVYYKADTWQRANVEFSHRPTNPPTEEPSHTPTHEPTKQPSKSPTQPPVPRPTYPGRVEIVKKEEDINLACLNCLQAAGDILSTVAQECYMSEEICHDAPTKVVKSASECIKTCEM